MTLKACFFSVAGIFLRLFKKIISVTHQFYRSSSNILSEIGTLVQNIQGVPHPIGSCYIDLKCDFRD